MDKYGGLLKKAAIEFSIVRGIEEPENSYKARVIYSIIGRMAIASLWDTPSNGYVSIVHMKHRIIELYNCYAQMFPEIRSEHFDASESLADEIYSIYLSTGCLYHEPNRIVAARKSSASTGNISFTRGYSLDEKQLLSGLGTYLYAEVSNYNAREFFMISSKSLVEVWLESYNPQSFLEFTELDHAEYLRMSPPYTRGYWVERPTEDGRVSLFRISGKSGKLYYFYFIDDGVMKASPIPQWKVDDSEYRTLSNACLAYNRTLPPIQFYYDGDIVHIKLQYLLPPAELNMVKLYSWPEQTLLFHSEFKRICNTDIFESIRTLLSENGYGFVEETYE